jgi:hypothetical protein
MDAQMKKRLIGFAVIAVVLIIGVRLLPFLINIAFIAILAGAAYLGYTWWKQGRG